MVLLSDRCRTKPREGSCLALGTLASLTARPRAGAVVPSASRSGRRANAGSERTQHGAGTAGTARTLTAAVTVTAMTGTGDGMYRLTVTLATGKVHSFTVGHMPRHWQSWVMQRLPYCTNYQGCTWGVRPL